MKGKKVGHTIVLEQEPEVPDGTEVEVILPGEWEGTREVLLGIGVHPDFGAEIDKAQSEWKPEEF